MAAVRARLAVVCSSQMGQREGQVSEELEEAVAALAENVAFVLDAANVIASSGG